MSVNSPRSLAQSVRDEMSGINENSWRRVELSMRLFESSAGICELNSQVIEDLRRTCLYQKESLMLQQEGLMLQRERLTELNHKLRIQRDRLRKEEVEIQAPPSV